MEKNNEEMAEQEEMLFGQHEVILNGDNGASLTFTGRLYSEASFFDEENGVMTKLKLFITDAKRLVYFVVSGSGQNKSRRLYELKVEDGFCHIFNGLQNLILPAEMLSVAVSGICGIAPGQAEELHASLEESLRAASA